jgi:hypothetical protein
MDLALMPSIRAISEGQVVWAGTFCLALSQAPTDADSNPSLLACAEVQSITSCIKHCRQFSYPGTQQEMPQGS